MEQDLEKIVEKNRRTVFLGFMLFLIVAVAVVVQEGASPGSRYALAGQAMARLAQPPLIVGDLTGNSVIDGEDLPVLREFVDGRRAWDERARVLGDLDQDGALTESDVRILGGYLQGKVGSLPINFGDINGDQRVTPDDLLLLAEFLDGMVSLGQDQLYRADLNADGNVDDIDKKLLVGMVSGS